jgi:hypothetical protein
MDSGALPFNAVEDMNRIIDLSLNIPNELKEALKKNATNDILTIYRSPLYSLLGLQSQESSCLS